jgi:hypothetical protein
MANIEKISGSLETIMESLDHVMDEARSMGRASPIKDGPKMSMVEEQIRAAKRILNFAMENM